MNKNALYGLVVSVFFFTLILPDTIDPTKGIIFTLEEWVSLIFFVLTIVFFKNIVTKITDKLNQKYPWRPAFKQRILIIIGILILSTSVISTIIIVPTGYYLNKNGIPIFYQEILNKKRTLNLKDDNRIRSDKRIIKNSKSTNGKFKLLDLSATVVKICFAYLLLLFVIEETYRYLNRQSQKKIELEKILKEQAQLKANVLKKQLDPHFIFNTLNVLSGLVYQDADKSAQFIKELSRVYRYVLEQSEELVSTVEQEFNFLESYLFLLKIRFEDKISITIDIPSNRKDWLLPSMTLELLVENAIKHNVVDSERPLYLNFSIKNDQLVVKNNLQQRNNFKESLGLGLKNLKTRLDLLDKKDYHFGIVENDFVAIIPLINPKDV